MGTARIYRKATKAKQKPTLSQQRKSEQLDIALYALSGVIFAFGGSIWALPIYKVFCQVTGQGGDPKFQQVRSDKIAGLQKNTERPIKITFHSEVSTRLNWTFIPDHSEIKVYPGETALAFYTAKNLSDRPIIGVATYNIQPFYAAQYFNKIQCFCFEEQILNPGEEVDMPVFFYLDPEFLYDHQLALTDEIDLSYTFFESRRDLKLPDFAQRLIGRTPEPS